MSSCCPSGQSWQPARASAAPEEWRPWLLHQGSLTLKLQQDFPGTFKVEVLRHDWGIPRLDERRMLDLHDCTCTSASIREVLLTCNDQPKVFARSILPATSLQGRNRCLLQLKDRPLGEVLFADPGLKRGKIEIASLAARTFNHCLPFDYDDQTVWGRRSVFYLSGQPILVSEFFLPDL